jgi:hypothetical protein
MDRTPRRWLAAAAALSAVACGDDHDHDHDHDSQTPAAEACEHLQEGPAQAVAAQLSADPTALADVSKAHTRFDIALAETATATYGGYVKYLSAKAGTTLLVADKALPVQIVDSLGVEVTPTTAAAAPACAAAKVQLGVALQVGTYRLKLGPTTAPQVGIVIEAP